ncbi:MAG: YigZ family protein [Bacilli bacterium]|nr:YigZ family protein [Bacilli bacterium]
MLSVRDSKNTLIVKKSKFITLIYHVDSIEQINTYLNNIKSVYKDATHYCYAYVLDGINKCSDDGEPSGTAGIPMLDVLKKNNLDHVLCIVVRYFGKILLGAGGLVRAYSRSVVECINNNIVELNKGYNIDIYFEYNNLKKIEYLLKNTTIKKKNFKKNITYNVDVTKDIFNNLNNSNICEVNINSDIYL